MLATWEILKNVITSRGEQDWQKYLPPREAIVQEMQAMQQQKEAEAQANSQQAQLMPNAVQKATEMGVPPEEAQKIGMQIGANNVQGNQKGPAKSPR